jgi:hypothetical protein
MLAQPGITFPVHPFLVGGENPRSVVVRAASTQMRRQDGLSGGELGVAQLRPRDAAF